MDLWRSQCSNTIAPVAFHPSEPWACWSPSAHKFCLASTATGKIERTTLPEPPDVDFGSAQSIHKEFYASGTDDRLMYLVLAATPLGTGMQCHLSVSRLELVRKGDDTLEVSALGPSSTLSYFVGEVSLNPLILTAWRPDHVCVALPPLSCKPKIVRLPFPPRSQWGRDNQPAFQTPRESIVFPSSTPFCHPRLSVDEKGILSLFLTAQSFASKPLKDAPNLIGPCETATVDNTEQGPFHISWSLDSRTDWRDWDAVTDSGSEQRNSMEDEARRLRGSYVAPGQPFIVPVRSGLDYRTKMFISC
ncbi:hypothetical protein PG997_002651 [Apiospora hydei]|uniref:Uncharacterized protein n=1 Tax=Apiospora hydei TaxID=1337664 RepID=A0ABR1WX23_9PEZI